MVTDANVGNHDRTENINTLRKSCKQLVPLHHPCLMTFAIPLRDLSPPNHRQELADEKLSPRRLYGFSTRFQDDHLQSWETIIFGANMGEANNADQKHHFLLQLVAIAEIVDEFYSTNYEPLITYLSH